MEKKNKLKILIITLAIGLTSLGMLIAGIVLLVNKPKPPTPDERPEIKNVVIDKTENEEYVLIEVSFDDIEKNTNAIVNLKYYEETYTEEEIEESKKQEFEGNAETDSESESDEKELILSNDKNETFRYNEDTKKFQLELYKAETERNLTNVKVEINEIYYNVADIVISKYIPVKKYYAIGAVIEMGYEFCTVLFNTDYETIITVDIYFNNELYEANVEINGGGGYKIDYSEKWGQENLIEVKNFRFDRENHYTDEKIECSFTMENVVSLEYFGVSEDYLYYLDEEIDATIVVEKKYNFEISKVVLNEKEFEVESLENSKNFESVKLTLNKDDLVFDEEKQNYTLVLNKIIFEKDYLEPNFEIKIDAKNKKIITEFEAEKEYYQINEEQNVKINFENPYNFEITKVLINDEYYEVSNSNDSFERMLTFTNEEKLELKEVVFLYKGKEYTLTPNQKIEFEIVEFATSYSLKNEYIYTEENIKKITLVFDKDISEYDVFVYNRKVEDMQEIFFEYATEKNGKYEVNIDVTDEIDNMGLYTFVIYKIEFKYKDIVKQLDLTDINTVLTVTYYKGVKDVLFGSFDSVTSVVEVIIEKDENVTPKIITLNILDENDNVVETRDYNLSYNEETKKYNFTSNKYEKFKVSISTICYEKEGLLYYVTLPKQMIYEIN